jgi:splicing factor 3B subunit 3
MYHWLLNSVPSSIALVKFANQADNQQFVIVGVAKDLQLNPRQVGGGFLYTYRLVNLNSVD